MSGALKVRRTRPGAKLPCRATAGAAAYDLCACLEKDVVIPAGGYAAVPTGIAIELPDESCVALVFSRSGHGFKKGVTLTNSVGVIDSDYRGELTVGLINHGKEPFKICAGDRIAQLMIIKLADLALTRVDVLDDTERGEGGFGSTGR